MFATGTLPPTASRPADKTEWSWSYLPSFTPGSLHAGVLRVTAVYGVRTKRVVTDEYHLDPTPLLGRPGTAWLLVKNDHRGDLDTVRGRESAARVGEVYECRLYAGGGHACTCTGGATEPARGTPCVHSLALRELVASGAVDDLIDSPHWLDRAAHTGEDSSPAPGEDADRGEDGEYLSPITLTPCR